MNEPRQKIMKTIGETGCYLLSIIHAAELATGKELDAIAIYLECLRKRWIGEDCYVIEPGKIYGYLVGGDWNLKKEMPIYKPADGEMVILCYERKTTMQTFTHFVCGDSQGNIEYDPLGKSQAVANGQLVSMRIFTRA